MYFVLPPLTPLAKHGYWRMAREWEIRLKYSNIFNEQIKFKDFPGCFCQSFNFVEFVWRHASNGYQQSPGLCGGSKHPDVLSATSGGRNWKHLSNVHCCVHRCIGFLLSAMQCQWKEMRKKNYLQKNLKNTGNEKNRCCSDGNRKKCLN